MYLMGYIRKYVDHKILQTIISGDDVVGDVDMNKCVYHT